MHSNIQWSKEPKQKLLALHDWFISNRVAVIVALLLIFTWPLGLYGLWKGKHFTVSLRWVVTGLMVLRAIYNFTTVTPQSSDPTYNYESCAATITEGNCTYYRDDDCNVVARLCE
ncbi:hypothetical protein P886_3317 [Alteromonadaceae bacterium 2753L.S.0a.02]|nr:hypothetical protein P886_3317 [Alteromonadaceae bacterium 2753L.S.0a.02]